MRLDCQISMKSSPSLNLLAGSAPAWHTLTSKCCLPWCRLFGLGVSYSDELFFQPIWCFWLSLGFE